MLSPLEDLRPIDPGFVDAIVTYWRDHVPEDGPALARRWLAAKQDGLLTDNDLVVLMAVRLGINMPDFPWMRRLVEAGWCQPAA